MQSARLVAAGLLAFALAGAAAQAERPIVDLHRLDANFELFAGDSSVPWKATSVRLDTYSSAPVAISVYAIDPAEVVTAGSNSRPRAIDTSRRRAVLSFTFTPPGGYQFQSNDVAVPLGDREGFFVVEARRGSVGEQVWINRTRVGLISKETPSGFLFYGVDLGTGEPLAHMRVQFVVNSSFVTQQTDSQGILRWNRSPRPVFALAQWGNSYAFLSLLPQPPVPSTIVGVRTDSAVVHAGGLVRVAGFARTRVNGVLRAGSGSAIVSIRSGARAIAERREPIDEAGAFAATLEVPPNAAAGEYAVLASAGGGVGGATLHVDGNAGGLSLDLRPACGGSCDAQHDVPLLVHASQGGVLVRLEVVRSPHVYLAYQPDEMPWGTASWLSTSVRLDASGNATVTIPRPLDNLGSTYGIHAESGGATAETRIIVPTADAAVRLNVDRSETSLGTAIGFDVYGESLDGKPLAGASVNVSLTHGGSVQQQTLVLDRDGHARGSFHSGELGTNLIFASVEHDGRATDAQAVQIDPQAASTSNDGRSPDVRIALAAAAYRTGEEVGVDASAPGAQGAALITYESALGVQTNVVQTRDGNAAARLRALDAAGELRIGAAFVHDGTIEWSTVPLALSAPGRPHLGALTLESEHLAPGSALHATLDGAGTERGTFVVRISRETPSGSALFSSAPALLEIGVSTTQNSAPESVTWHPWVDSTGDHAQVLGFVRRTQPPLEASLAQAETETVSWSIARGRGDGFPVVLPDRDGRYVLSVLEISDDGSVSAGTSTIVVH